MNSSANTVLKAAANIFALTPETLDTELAALKKSAGQVAQQMRLTNRSHYEHLASLYLWWRNAEQAPGYLEEAYAGLGRRFKKKTSQAVNFAPLFRLTWGNDNGLTDDMAWRWSLALNYLHTVYSADSYFHTDSVARLGDRISEKGGVDGIVSSITAANDNNGLDDDPNGGGAAAKPAYDRADHFTGENLVQLFSRAANFYGSIKQSANIAIDTPIPLIEDMGMVLVRRVADKYQFIRASNDTDYVQQEATHAYLRDFTALAPSVRMILEAINTQCLPAHLQKHQANLLERITSSGKTKAISRLIYRHASREWILSPVDAASGVITIAKPSKCVLEKPASDLFLLQQSRRAVELKLVSGRRFNLFAPSHTRHLPVEKRDGFKSHSLRLENVSDKADQFALEILPFCEHTPAPYTQLVPKDSIDTDGAWRATLNLAWFRKFDVEITSRWLGDIGLHIKRKRNKIFQLDFDGEGMTVHYDYSDGKFARSHPLTFDGASATSKPISVMVQTRDFAIAMHAIADMPATTPVEIDVDADLLMLRFSTSAAAYSMYIPTCDKDGICSTARFEQYTPAMTKVLASEDYLTLVAGELSTQVEQP